ncbi:isoleucine--tRNA ligase [Arenicella sp. 4NH20-0111]|uniref:isoleucine--tRNA ligase n=1 Tax=Arenicella sp. 4NH20-0111 TaxID=3127648 RepID=UPI0031069871
MSKDKPGSQYKDTINLPKTAFPMKAGLPNREPQILKKWSEIDAYHNLQSQRADAPTYVLHDGPPYANGNIHIGHSVNKILKDIIVKSRNLQGMRSPYVPGWDCHGLPIEIQVEKKHGKAGQKIDKKTFRQKCREYAQRQVETQKADFKRLGVQGDWENPYLTMAFETEANIVRSLSKIVEGGHLYHGLMPVYWCPACGSALAEAEVEYQDKVSPAIDVKFDVADLADLASRVGVSLDLLRMPAVVIWTTTPWTMPANEAVSLHPELEYVLVNVGDEQLILAEELMTSALERYEIEGDIEVLARFKGQALELLNLKHPFYDKLVPAILGDHVTIEAGTGAVHTAPAHGGDDFAVGKRYNIPVNNPVGSNGTFLESTELFAGEFVFKANPHVIEVLAERGALLKHVEYEHSYPHCWRHKTPMIYRATAQWFIGMEYLKGDQALRYKSLKAIDTVDWEPDWGKARIKTMVEGRPDWCVSRQRNWGVPIAIYLHKETGKMHPDTVQLMELAAQRIEQEGIQAWYDLDDSELLGDEADQYDKVTDTLDVWFDSGVTHNSVVNAREELQGPADLYLEGSDQHRGWFQSSLLSSVAMTGKAPYKTVLTHGFTVDKDGKKMSKSLGNVMAPQEVINSLGADVLRLWIAATDYRSEMTISKEILQRTSESYRRIRNTTRYLLGNLSGFEPNQALAYEDMLSLDQWALRLASNMQKQIEDSYENYQFHQIYQRLHQFCVVDMGGFYLDILKDRLYTTQANSKARLSAQTAMQHILESLVRVLTPILSFTAEEIWGHMAGDREESVLFATRYEFLDSVPLDSAADDNWAQLIAIRNEVAKQIELLRVDGKIGSALDAGVELYADGSTHEILSSVGDELRFILITSAANLKSLSAAPSSAVPTDVTGLKLLVSALEDEKCVRCWHRRPDVGSIADHPELCGRCVENVDGEGEPRIIA